MLEMDHPRGRIVGPQSALPVLPGDHITRKLAMLLEGQCEGFGAARKYGYSKQRYYQLLKAYLQGGGALESHKRGPKTNYRRRDEVLRQVIRYRFLDPDASADVIAQKLRQTGRQISARSVARVIAEFGLQKKLYAFRPSAEAIFVESQHTRRRQRREPSDAASIQRGVRQLLAQKISGTMVGVWLPAAEHLRLGVWDLLCGWTGRPGCAVEPRLALQLVHEAALCVSGVRHNHCLSQKLRGRQRLAFRRQRSGHPPLLGGPDHRAQPAAADRPGSPAARQRTLPGTAAGDRPPPPAQLHPKTDAAPPA